MDIGATLSHARKAQGLSIADVAEVTRIRASLIEALERNDFDACGGDVFARGHVRTVATALALDPNPLVEAMGAINVATTLEAVEPESLDIWELHSRAHVPSEARVWGLVAVVAAAIVAALVWHARANDLPPALDPSALPSVTTSATATVTPEPTPTATLTETPSSTPTATPTSTPIETVAPGPGAVGAIVLDIQCTDTSWVQVRNASGVLFQATMRAGDAKSLSSDTDVTVRIGNAAGVTLTVNDLDYGSLGAPGEVFTRTFRVG